MTQASSSKELMDALVCLPKQTDNSNEVLYRGWTMMVMMVLLPNRLELIERCCPVEVGEGKKSRGPAEDEVWRA